MTDRILLTASDDNIADCLALAHEAGTGLEVMHFATPDVLDGDWRAEVARYRALLRDLPGPLTLHGPFMDTASGSPDARANALALDRYRHALDIAAELGAERVVFHANFIGSLRNRAYRDGWHARNVTFWGQMAAYAAERGRVIALENMWEYAPGILSDLLREVNHPALMACIDVGHAHLFGDDAHSITDWLTDLQPWIVHAHVNNNDGLTDVHRGFDWPQGVLDYHVLLKQIRGLPNAPDIVLEMWHVAEMRASLGYFDITPSPR